MFMLQCVLGSLNHISMLHLALYHNVIKGLGHVGLFVLMLVTYVCITDVTFDSVKLPILFFTNLQLVKI
jgi:hypothetical protein